MPHNLRMDKTAAAGSEKSEHVNNLQAVNIHCLFSLFTLILIQIYTVRYDIQISYTCDALHDYITTCVFVHDVCFFSSLTGWDQHESGSQMQRQKRFRRCSQNLNGLPEGQNLTIHGQVPPHNVARTVSALRYPAPFQRSGSCRSSPESSCKGFFE